ncbi:MAG TPA: VOC family protein [Acidimicrobiales bacterium]|nr:VOC family protein [Acidimicrobiales bacterium]
MTERSTDTSRDGTPSAAPRHEPTQGLYGWITHTDLASSDPDATRTWCEAVLGWRFMATMESETAGRYHLFSYSDQGVGGIRGINPPETPGSVPFVHVPDARAAFDAAIAAGAEEIVAPARVMEGVTTAIVRAPGGVAIGFSGP